MPSNRRLLIATAIASYLLIACVVFGLIWHATNGHFAYTLDDPYIHMAVARHIAQNHYGINTSETSSPSSSILWPFLLVPFADHFLAPLCWNLLAGILTAGILGWAVSEWPESEPPSSVWRAILSTIALLFIGNLVGTTFLGMEHGLQVLLSVVCAFGICRVLNGRPMPLWCVAAAAIAPAIRYEDLALTLAVAAALIGAGRKQLAIALGIVALMPLLAFSAFLHIHGLPLLPLSVLVKGKAAQTHINPVLTALRLMASGTFHALTDPLRWPMVLLFTILTTTAWRERDRIRRFALAGAAAAIALHLLFGRFGWFHRYEVYALVFASLIVLHLLQSQRPIPLTWYALGLVALATPYVQAVSESVLSAEDVYGQQYQMARFATDYYGGNVAVSDLGLVGYTLAPAQYVLDLGGLASLETARAPIKSAAWLQATTQDHKIGLVMVYPGMLDIPKSWLKLGTICLRRPPVALGGTCVDFFASDPAQVPFLKNAYSAFNATLPSQTYSVPALPSASSATK